MANDYLNILRQGVKVWNDWRESNPNIRPELGNVDLTGARLSGINLSDAYLNGSRFDAANLANAILRKADLSNSILYNANLKGATLDGATLSGTGFIGADLCSASLIEATAPQADFSLADLNGANFAYANLFQARFEQANLSKAFMRNVRLDAANLIKAKLHGAFLAESNLAQANFREADLTGCNLEGAVLIRTNFAGAILSKCQIFGISAWALGLENTIQKDLVITQSGEPVITVDNLEVAQFIYLLLYNEKLRDVIDTITSKAVLILGRFTPERMAILDALTEELRKRNYTPIIFKFEKPSNRNLTETVMTLAGMARFVIADLSDPNSIPHELMSFVEKFRSVPVQPIFSVVPEHRDPYPMFADFADLRHVLPIYKYDSQEKLIAVLYEKIIQPAENKLKELRPGS